MTWTAPRTFADGEVVTKAMFDAQIRDNFAVLKVIRDSNGRLSGLSSATLADLTPLSGFAMVGSGNDFTAGRHRFLDPARVVLPVGSGRYESLGGGLRRGIWIDGDYLHWIEANQTTEVRRIGTLLTTPAGPTPRAGSLWIESVYLKYIDSTNHVRRLGGALVATVAAGIPGSLWIQVGTLRYLDAARHSRSLTGVVVAGVVDLPVVYTAHDPGNVLVTGNDLTNLGVPAWGYGEISTKHLNGDGFVEVTASETTTDRSFGLNHTDAGHSFTNMEFSFNLDSGGGLNVYHSFGGGVINVGTYVTGDKLTVGVDGGIVVYRQNGTLVYTSGFSLTFPLFVDTAMFNTGATINDALLTGAWT